MRFATNSYLTVHRGRPCPYCERIMGDNDMGLEPTRDHYPIPKSRGGTRTVVCCRDCNGVKGDMSVAEWLGFRARNPEWWKRKPPKRLPRQRRKKFVEVPSTPMRDALEQHAFTKLVARAFDDKFVRGAHDPDEAG